MGALGLDFRYALRQLAKNPGFTAVVVLTLALGIGANTAIFTLMDQVLFRKLPVREPESLVILDAPGRYSGSTHSHDGSLRPVSHSAFLALRDSGIFSGVLAYYTAAVHVGADGETERADGCLVSGTYFEVLGLRPAAGRLFTPDDDRKAGAHPVVVLGHGYWQRRFAGDPGVVGRTLSINGGPMTVVGVAPRGFHGTDVGGAIDVYVPLMMQRQVIPIWSALDTWRVAWLTPFARLKDGLSLEETRARVDVLYRRLLEEDLQTIEAPSVSLREAFLKKTLRLLPGAHGASVLRTESRPALLVLTGMVGLVLLIACGNLANLLLARASSRQREVAVRLALGASRARLLRQLLVESLVSSLLGGVLGLAMSSWAASLLLRALPDEGARRVLSPDPDWRVALFALLLACATGVLFGLAPALQSTHPGVFQTLRQEAGNLVGSGGPLRIRKALAVAQVALSLLLLVGAGLFARSLGNLRSLDPGFDPRRVLAFSVDPSLNGYDDIGAVGLLTRIRDDLASEPGVESVSMADLPLMTGSDYSMTVRVEGYEAKEGEDMNPDFNDVAPEFFDTLGIPLVSGRDFTDADAGGAPKVVIVNEAFARRYFKDQDPVGRHLGRGGRAKELDMTIVGVVKDGKSASLKEEQRLFVYRPYTQVEHFGMMTVYVRVAGPVGGLPDRIRQIVRAADPALPVADLKTMTAQISEALFTERMTAALSAAFGLLATALAALGLYGVMSYAVSLRTREIGIRMALGAERRSVIAVVMAEVALLTALGIVIGLPSAFGLGSVVRSQLYGLSPADPATAVAATVLLAAVSLGAGSLPAWRASRVDPMDALRHE